ncbi:DNA-binding transcriptional LysR family regulator [Providencia alcalifaciens]|nr:DNA-binding transcriptional LysR family regulator [Providencia alcalifaciens]
MLINKNTFAFKAKIESYAIFRHLELFIKIVECNSFSLAAKKLNVTPSSVSRGLQQLEEQLGVVLLKRTTRNFILTDAGRYLLQRSQNLLSDLDDSLVNTASFYQHAQGQLKITCSIAFGVCQLMQIYSEYRETNSKVSLSVDLCDTLINLNEVDFDIALRITNHPPDNFALRKICNINWVYCGSRVYFERYGIPQSPSDIAQHNCLINPNIPDTWRMTDKSGHAYPLEINNMIEVNSSLGLLEAARCHQGIVCLPTYMLGNYIETGELIPVLLDYNPKSTPFALYALYHPAHIHAPKIRTFIDFLVEKIPARPHWDQWMLKNNL